MTIKKHPIGIFGGTFDPIHYGHIHLAEQLIDGLELQGMQFLPNKNPMYRDKPVANAVHRLAMVRLATARYPRFIVNDVEIKREGPTYTIDTVSAIREQIPDQPLCLILGNDVFARMNQWKDWEKIPDLLHLVIINRLAAAPSQEDWMRALLEEREICDIHLLSTQPGGSILQFEIEPLLISATEIRRKIKAGEDVSDNLPPEILRYIDQHHLYR